MQPQNQSTRRILTEAVDIRGSFEDLIVQHIEIGGAGVRIGTIIIEALE
jgi:hypothetical protein